MPSEPAVALVASGTQLHATRLQGSIHTAHDASPIGNASVPGTVGTMGVGSVAKRL